MIIKEEFLSRLRKIFDLNLYEAKVWTALLSRGVSTAGELSNISDVPRSRTYDILESLEKKGFIVMKVGKPIKFVALKPEEVVERVKKNLIVNAHEKSKRLEQLKGDEVLDELTSLFTNGVKFVEPSDLSGNKQFPASRTMPQNIFPYPFFPMCFLSRNMVPFLSARPILIWGVNICCRRKWKGKGL